MSNKEDEEEKRLYRCARTYNKIVGQVVCNVYLSQFIFAYRKFICLLFDQYGSHKHC